jgi:hypothetical protein
MRRRWYLLVAGALVFTVSCSSGGEASDAPGACSAAEGGRGVGIYEPSPPEDLLQWVGFKDVGKLEVIGADEECGLDASARLALRGDPAAIDAALAAADFAKPPTPGLSVFQTPLDGVDLQSLTDVVSSEQQTWENSAGERLVRMYVRGTQADGQGVLHVWAFTT